MATTKRALLAALILTLWPLVSRAAVAEVTAASSHVATCALSDTTGTITQPPAGDLIIVYVLSSTTGTLGLPTGFTQKDAQTNSYHFIEGYKIATGSGETSFTYTTTVANGNCDSWTIVLSGENQTTPFDGHTVNLSVLTGTAGPFATTAATALTGDLPVTMLNTGTLSQVVSSKSPTTLTDLGDSGLGSNHLMYDATVAAGSYNTSMTMTTTNNFAHQVEVLDLIAPAATVGSHVPALTTTGVGPRAR